MSAIHPNDSLCAMCSSNDTLACSGCHSVRYCSKRCQKSDWPLHKILCKSFGDVSDSARPKEDGGVYRRAILFPENEDSPRWFWLRDIEGDKGGIAVPDATQPLLKQGMEPVQVATSNPVLERRLRRSITLFGLPTALSMTQNNAISQENKSLLKVDKELPVWVRGPIFATGYEPVTVHAQNTFMGMVTLPWKEQVFDLTPTEFRHGADLMRLLYDQTGQSCDIYTKGSTEKVKGVRLNCIGDYNILIRSQFEPLTVNKSLCDEESELDIKITDKVGIPLIARRIPHSLAWRGRKFGKTAPGESPSVMRLQVQKQWEGTKGITDPEEVELARWRVSDGAGKEGSCVIVRKDGQALDWAFLQALAQYAPDKLGEAEDLRGATGVWKEDVLDSVSKEEWHTFYNKFVCEKQAAAARPPVSMPGATGGSMPFPFPPGFPFFNTTASSGNNS